MHQPGKSFRRFGNMAENVISLGHFGATNELAVLNERKRAMS
jgi:hypothetical protein